jgi:hypothetical protein
MRHRIGLVTLSCLWALAVAALPAPAAGAALASAPTNWKGVTLDLVSVERKGSVLTVKWSTTNGGSADAQVRFALEGQQVTTYVVDEESGTKYYVLTDKEKHSVASEHVYLGGNTNGIEESVAPGETRRFWAKFPAPPPQVKQLTFFFTETEPFEEVPITDR